VSFAAQGGVRTCLPAKDSAQPSASHEEAKGLSVSTGAAGVCTATFRRRCTIRAATARDRAERGGGGKTCDSEAYGLAQQVDMLLVELKQCRNLSKSTLQVRSELQQREAVPRRGSHELQQDGSLPSPRGPLASSGEA
jgi:hypothetical protein